ncbi:mgtC family protein, partial [Yersinia pestis PY-92]
MPKDNGVSVWQG